MRVYVFLVQNASVRFAIHLLSLEWHQRRQNKEGQFWTRVLPLDREKSGHPWLLLDSARSRTLRFGIIIDTLGIFN